MTWMCYDEAGGCVMPNMLSPRGLVFGQNWTTNISCFQRVSPRCVYMEKVFYCTTEAYSLIKKVNISYLERQWKLRDRVYGG